MYKNGFGINNLQWLMYNKKQTNNLTNPRALGNVEYPLITITPHLGPRVIVPGSVQSVVQINLFALELLNNLTILKQMISVILHC